MKKQSFLLIALLFFTSALFAQQLTYKFANPRIIRVSGFDYFEFDVQVKADVAGTSMFTGQINLNFDNTTLSTNAAQWTYTVAPAFAATNTQSIAKYAVTRTLTGTVPNKVVNFAFTGEPTAFSDDPFDPNDWVEMTTSYQTMVTVRARITSSTGAAGIRFIQASMNGQQEYIYDVATTAPYTSPNLYDASDFYLAKVGRFYSTAWGWSQVGNTVNAQWVDWTTAVNTSVWEGSATLPSGSESKVSALYIHSPATLTIPATGKLTATGTTTLNGAQCLIINSEGSFIDNGFAGAGTARVEKSLLQNRWYYAGLPLSTSVAASSFGTISTVANTNTHLYYWNEAGQAYAQIPNGSTTINPGPLRGYSVKDYSNPISAAFVGTLNTGTVANASLTYTSGTTAGYNLVCNPYPSAIDLGTWNGSNATTSTGVTVANLETSIWYRTNSTFSTYNWTSGTGQGSPAGQSKVPAMQAFWVRTISSTTGSLQFNNSVRLHNAQAFYKTTAETNVFRMNVSDGTNTDEAVVGFYQDAQNAFENFDSEKMMVVDDVPQIYSLTGDNTEVAINGQPDLTASEERIIPLGFSTNIAGTFTLNATNLADFNPSVSVYLEDLQQSVLQDLRQNNLYNFTSGVVNSTSRFKLHFAYMLTSLSTELAPAALVYADDNEIYVNSPSASTVEVFNALGKKVSDGKAEKGLNKFPLNTAKGFYIVKVQTGSAIVTKKVFAGK